MDFNKKGQIGKGTITTYATGFIVLVILFLVVAELLPEAQTAGDAINATGAPLGSLFTSGGVVWLVIMAGIVLLILGSFLKKK